MNQQKDKIYVYPNYGIGSNKKNPYIYYLSEALLNNFTVINFRKKVKKGVYDLVYHLDAKIFVINWPENIPDRKFGIIQCIIYSIILFFFKIVGKKIVWIMHNKEPHNKRSKIASYCMFLTAKMSSFTITHAIEGVNYYKEKFKRNNIFHFPHPIYPNLEFDETINKEYDFIIWGSIDRYKNILGFIQFISQNMESKKYNFLICGYCKDSSYLNQIQELILANPNVTFINQFLVDSDLVSLISKSRAILYTYDEDSVLSSGSLVFSLSSKKIIIGPEFGNFKELASEGMIANYSNFSDIFQIYNSFEPNTQKIDQYIYNYTWAVFSNYIKETNSKAN